MDRGPGQAIVHGIAKPRLSDSHCRSLFIFTYKLYQSYDNYFVLFIYLILITSVSIFIAKENNLLFSFITDQ